MRRLAPLLFCLSAIVHAQEPIRITARTVQVHAVVQDAKGLPVRDLTRDDFAIYDEKTKQEINFFSKEWRTAELPAAPLPPNTFTNRIDQRPGAPSAVTVVLFDQKNTEWDRQQYSKEEVLRALEKADPEHRIALYALADQLRILHDFTSDTQALVDTLADAGIRGKRGAERLRVEEPQAPLVDRPHRQEDYKDRDYLREADRAELLRWMTSQESRFASMDLRRQVEETAIALEAIAWRLSRIPGRKNLIWVSSSFPFSFTPATAQFREGFRLPEHVLHELERAAQSLTAASVSVYPVYAGASTLRAPSDAGDDAARGARLTELRNNQDGMRLLAEGTGGKAFLSIERIPEALQRAADDSRVNYVLGYTPSHNEWDGRYRRIRVEVKRRGVEVRYRSGYVAVPERAQTPEERTKALSDAVWSPLDATGVGVDVKVEDSGKPGAIKLATLLDPRSISLALDGGRYTGALDVLYVQEGPDGRNLRGVRDEIKLNMTAETRERMLKEKQVAFRKEIERVAGADHLRIVVRDPGSGLIGAVTVPLQPQSSN